MADNQKSVFDRLDSIEAAQSATMVQNEKILEYLKDLNSNQNKEKVKEKPSKVNDEVINQKKVNNDSPTELKFLQLFLKNSKKEHVWFGSEKEFTKAKFIVKLVIIGLIVVGILSTIFTSIALKIYSTFTLLENIWLAFSCVLLSYAIHLRKRVPDIDLKMHSNFIYIQDADGTWRESSNEKKKYKWFRRISYISCLANMICVWCFSTGGGIAVLATIFEIAFLGLSIGVYFAMDNFYSMYGTFILYTNRNLSNTENVTLVFDVYGKNLALYNEYREKLKGYI